MEGGDVAADKRVLEEPFWIICAKQITILAKLRNKSKSLVEEGIHGNKLEISEGRAPEVLRREKFHFS
jgi:hypothetical protein